MGYVRFREGSSFPPPQAPFIAPQLQVSGTHPTETHPVVSPQNWDQSPRTHRGSDEIDAWDHHLNPAGFWDQMWL